MQTQICTGCITFHNPRPRTTTSYCADDQCIHKTSAHADTHLRGMYYIPQPTSAHHNILLRGWSVHPYNFHACRHTFAWDVLHSTAHVHAPQHLIARMISASIQLPRKVTNLCMDVVYIDSVHRGHLHMLYINYHIHIDWSQGHCVWWVFVIYSSTLYWSILHGGIIQYIVQKLVSWALLLLISPHKSIHICGDILQKTESEPFLNPLP